MELDLDGLRRHEDRLVCLRFTDGEVVEARLLGVDAAEHMDVMYEASGNTFVAALSELRSWSAVGDRSHFCRASSPFP